MTKRPDFCTPPRLILGVIIVWEEGNAQNEFYSYRCVNNWEGLVIKENSINWIGSHSFFLFFFGGEGDVELGEIITEVLSVVLNVMKLLE